MRVEELPQLQSGAPLALELAMLLHDFNNILAPLLLLSGRLTNEVEEGSLASLLAGEIHSTATLGASLVRDALNRTRTRTRTQVTEPVDVNLLVTERLALIGRVLGARVAIETVLAENAGEVLADRTRLEHALLNLVANARDAMRDGGQLTLATRLVARRGRAFVALSIRDSGVGMTSEVRRRAFDAFFTTKEDSGARGIGLASVQRFADETGGHVTLESEPMQGTTATLFLPAVT